VSATNASAPKRPPIPADPRKKVNRPYKNDTKREPVRLLGRTPIPLCFRGSCWEHGGVAQKKGGEKAVPTRRYPLKRFCGKQTGQAPREIRDAYLEDNGKPKSKKGLPGNRNTKGRPQTSKRREENLTLISRGEKVQEPPTKTHPS